MLCNRLSLPSRTPLAVTAWNLRLADTDQLAEHLYGELRGTLPDEPAASVPAPARSGGHGRGAGQSLPCPVPAGVRDGDVVSAMHLR
ncbi:hypothetical protein ACRAWF_22240 [Streptomyces sp. L7]